MKINLPLPASVLAASLACALSSISMAAVVPVTGVTGHDGGNWTPTLGHLTDMVNALYPGWATADHSTGMTTTNPADPAAWTYSGTNWQQEWKANSRLNPATSTNAKIGWAVIDLGSVTSGLDKMYLWNVRSQNTTENVATYNLYHASSPTATLPAMPNSKAIAGDYNFASGGWTLLNTGGALTLPVNGANNNTPQSTVALGGISARYIGIEILTAGNGTAAGRVGVAQVEFTQSTPDSTPPTLSGITDNQAGTSIDVNTKVTYTVTFSEDMAAGSVSAADFNNAGTSVVSIGAISENTPGVFTVEVTPTTTGTLQLRIPAGAIITDVSNNLLDTSSELLDDKTFTVTTDTTPPTVASITDNKSGGPIAVNSAVTYTVIFSEDMNAGTVSSADFDNAGTSALSFGTITETSPGVFTVVVTPTTEGMLQLRIPVGASMTDTAGIPLANNPAILDDTTLAVQLSLSNLATISAITGSHGGDQYANGMISLNNGSGINKPDPQDPSTWTFNGTSYPEEWMATYLKVGGSVTPGLNAKVAWACLDFGSAKGLGTLYLFNTNYSSGISGTAQYNLYYASSPAVSLPAQPAKNTYSTTGLTPQGDYNFNDAGWTKFNIAGPLSVAQAGITSVALPGVSARYLAIEILSNQGDSTGGGRVGFDEIAVTAAPPDTDADGLPDAYEFANTSPQSTTSLDPAVDIEPDGLTTWQEYVLGTDPRDADTDNDTLNDGPETVGVGSRPPTNPLLADSDGDMLSDLVETNIPNAGTNPVLADTDADGLKDNVETNNGTYTSASNTGTSPLNPDSDSDGAGDWYEVAIIDKDPDLGSPPNSPNSSGLKPNIPYPLAGERGSPAASNAPVKVFIMSGQSNMVGFGQIAGTKPGTLQTITAAENKFPNLITAGGAWATRNDVYYRGVISDLGDGPLKADVAGDKIGPELGFGHVMGWYFGEPVLLIKSSIGNRSLMWDFAAPGTPSFNYAVDSKTYAGYGQAPNSWLTATGAPSPFIWYAGKQFDDCFKKERDMSQLNWQIGTAYQEGGNIGSQVRHNGVEYQCTVAHTASAATEPGVVGGDWATVWKVFTVDNAADVLDSFASHYAGAGKPFAGRDFEIAGYVWWQGYGDQGEPAATRYRENMARFITQIRAYYENRYPTKTQTTAPFVLATFAADGGWSNPGAGAAKVAQAQLDVAGDVSNVKTIEARGFWRASSVSPTGEGFHYNWNAETYMLAGDALGRAMVDLESVTPPGNTYADWIGTFPGAAAMPGFDQDADGDGIDNGAENFFGTNPSVGSAGLVSGAASGNTFTFTHPQNANPATGVTAAYRWSKDLAIFRNHGQSDGTTTVTFNAVTNAGITTVTATVTGAPTAKLFVDIKVNQN